RQRFTVGIKPHRHRGAGAEPGEQEIIGARTGVLATGRHGLISQHLVRTDRHGLLELAVAGFLHHDLARCLTWRGGGLRRNRFATSAIRLCSAMSSRNSRLMWNGRPASETSTLPCLRMSSMRSPKRWVTWRGSEGAAMVTTAFASGI